MSRIQRWVWPGCWALLLFVVASCSSGGGPDSGTSGGAATSSGGSSSSGQALSEPIKPNILLIISDDLGLDASSQYSVSSDLPLTPTLDSLAASGVVFENAWATPACTTTRGSLITGLHGINSGVDTVPNIMDTSLLTLQRALSSDVATADYNSAVIGKWHIAGTGNNLNHPQESGVDYYWGNIAATIESYDNWVFTTDGTQSTSTTYHTTAVTNTAIDWLATQTAPWFLWLAYVAPHSPYHLPPQNLHARNLTGASDDIAANKREYYLAAIEAMDAEIGRLLGSMSEDERANTLIFYLGDNGTPGNVIDTSVFAPNKAKNTLYEGGVRVPMLVSGAGVTRAAARETALVNSVDFFPSILEATGAQPVDDLDGESFYGLLGNNYQHASARSFNYTEFVSASVTGWAVRNAQYKLLELEGGTQELYDVANDLDESENLIANGVGDFQGVIDSLAAYAYEVRGFTVTPPVNNPVDITNVTLTSNHGNCAQYANSYTSRVTDVGESQIYDGSLSITMDGDECVFATNAIPNHDFNDGALGFPNMVSEQSQEYRVSSSPEKAVLPTALSLTVDNALLLNGVKVDLLAAACYGVDNEKTGCNDINQPWRFDPMFSANGFRVDSHNAHTQPDGTYHYHGTPNALFDEQSQLVVVGFSADGFPIFGSYFDDGSGFRKASSSYRLRTGARPAEAGSPGENYDGTYRDDYEYIAGAGDLDECNGMEVNGVYGYFITDDYPYVLACFSGVPHVSFRK